MFSQVMLMIHDICVINSCRSLLCQKKQFQNHVVVDVFFLIFIKEKVFCHIDHGVHNQLVVFLPEENDLKKTFAGAKEIRITFDERAVLCHRTSVLCSVLGTYLLFCFLRRMN